MRTLLAVLFGLSLCHAQQTLQLKEGQSSPTASIHEVAWIQGHWTGEAFGGIAEELWSPPAGESMMFVFRLLHDGKVTFYEIGHIKETEGTLIMQLKHFDADLKGWEKKDDTVDFKLVKLQEDAVFFEGLTIKRISENNIRFIVLIEENEKAEEVVFHYTRVGVNQP